MRRFEAIIFDLGGTLIYFDAEWPEVLSRADRELLHSLRSSGLVLDETFLRRFREQLDVYYQERESEFIEYTTLYVLRNLLAEWGYPDLRDDALRPALDAMYAVSQAHWQVETDAIPTLQALKSRGYWLGLISNAGDDPDVQVLIDKAGIRNFFDVIVTSAGCGIRKPNPRIFKMVLDRMGVPAERAVMVGDTLGADILGARNAGLFGVWITRRADTPANRAHAGTIRPDAVIESLSQLPELLDRLSV